MMITTCRILWIPVSGVAPWAVATPWRAGAGPSPSATSEEQSNNEPGGSKANRAAHPELP